MSGEEGMEVGREEGSSGREGEIVSEGKAYASQVLYSGPTSKDLPKN